MSNFDTKPVIIRKKPAAKQNSKNLAEETETKQQVGLEVGKKISFARNAAGMKQIDLARKININSSVISDWESGKALFVKDIANKIEKTLNIKLI